MLEPLFRWHRELVRSKWTHQQKKKVRRPPTADEVKVLIVRLALENTDWGYGKIQGELLKLGIQISDTAIRNILKASGIVPGPVRAGSLGWKKLMHHYREQMLACDFFIIETGSRQSTFSL
jgi:putative transposase